jgi:DNA-binding IclR family transcriptional regulator
MKKKIKDRRGNAASAKTSLQRKETHSGVESIETGMRLLLAFVSLGDRTHQLKTLAEAAHMPPSKAHRYLVSFIRMGLVDRDQISGLYRLGPKSIELGASALYAMDAFAVSVEAMIELRDQLDHTMVLTVWGSGSPVIIRVEEADQLVTVSFRVGKSVPLLGSAAGLLFSAFLPPSVIEPLLQAELKSNREQHSPQTIKTMADAHLLLDDVRARRLARIAGDITPGINAMGAAVFDSAGRPATAISAVGPGRSFDYGWNGTIATALRDKTEELSRKLGFSHSALRKQLRQNPA